MLSGKCFTVLIFNLEDKKRSQFKSLVSFKKES